MIEDAPASFDPARAAEKISEVASAIRSVYLGDHGVVDSVLRTMASRGHILIEDVPGVGKTLLAMATARAFQCSVSRIQMTPDLLPSDVIGVTIIDPETGQFVLRKGPVFANIVLADEINRTTPRTQSALLEAMSEASVSIDGHMHKLEQPFTVLATQNPYEFEGTYPLPENQLDRFFMRSSLGYPSASVEADVLELRPAGEPLDSMTPVATRHDLLAIQAATDAVRIERSLLDYIVQIASATRTHEAVQVGVSTRGSLALAQAARATAVVDARDYVIPEDIYVNVEPVCAHRLVLRAGLHADGFGTESEILRTITESVPSPA